MKNIYKTIGLASVLASALLLSGCNYDVLNPNGYIAQQQLKLIYICVGVMLCVVVPVMIAIVWFAIKYRATNAEAEYLPDWGHSNKVEAFMWGIPICIVIVLATMTAIYTFRLEPSKLIPEAVAGTQRPLQVNAVAMDWKWLFIYPEYGVASINEIYAPENRQVLVQTTAEQSVSAFWVPSLGTMLYAMPQMNGKLHLIADRQGAFNGVNANFTGDGFANMRFKWHSVDQAGFDAWIAQVRQSDQILDRSQYLKLADAPAIGDYKAQEEDAKIRYFSHVEPRLYYRIVNRCVADGIACNEDLMKKAAAESLWGELCSVFDPGVVQN